MNSTTVVATALGFVVWTWAGVACQAQAPPVLERLEQKIRNRIEQPAEPAQATAENAPADRPAAKAGSETDGQPGYVGIIADDAQDRGRGVRVLEVRPDGPADKAGLRKQDLITAVAGARVRQMTDMADVLMLYPAGEPVVFDVLRGEKPVQVKVTLGRRSSPWGKLPIRPPELPIPPTKAPGAEPLLAGPRLDEQPPAAAAEPASEIELLRRRVEQLEHRVAELERALAESLRKH
jgi:membrane-associated protease RseP (regulator of RpoE activity)